MGFPILPFFLIFLIWLAFRLKKLDAKQEQQEADFSQDRKKCDQYRQEGLLQL